MHLDQNVMIRLSCHTNGQPELGKLISFTKFDYLLKCISIVILPVSPNLLIMIKNKAFKYSITLCLLMAVGIVYMSCAPEPQKSGWVKLFNGYSKPQIGSGVVNNYDKAIKID